MRGWLLTSTYLETWIPRIVTVGRMGLGKCSGEVNDDFDKQSIVDEREKYKQVELET